MSGWARICHSPAVNTGAPQGCVLSPLLPLVINNSSVTVVEHFKFLGTTITNTLKRDNNIPQLVMKGPQCLFFLRQLTGLHVSPPIMVQFYRAVIESILTSPLMIR